MSIDTAETQYETPADLLTVNFRVDKEDDSDRYESRRDFWIDRRRGSNYVRIGFPEPHGFVPRECKLKDLIKALEELDDFEVEDDE